MPKKDILINIHGCQYVDGEKGVTKMTTMGNIECFENGYEITYMEDEEGGLDGCEMNLRIEDGKRVTLTRVGDYNSQMVLEKGQRNICHYETPYGGIMFGIFTEKVFTKREGLNGEMSFSYTIDMNNDVTSKNEINIKFKEVES